MDPPSHRNVSYAEQMALRDRGERAAAHGDNDAVWTKEPWGEAFSRASTDSTASVASAATLGSDASGGGGRRWLTYAEQLRQRDREAAAALSRDPSYRGGGATAIAERKERELAALFNKGNGDGAPRGGGAADEGWPTGLQSIQERLAAYNASNEADRVEAKIGRSGLARRPPAAHRPRPASTLPGRRGRGRSGPAEKVAQQRRAPTQHMFAGAVPVARTAVPADGADRRLTYAEQVQLDEAARASSRFGGDAASIAEKREEELRELFRDNYHGRDEEEEASEAVPKLAGFRERRARAGENEVDVSRRTSEACIKSWMKSAEDEDRRADAVVDGEASGDEKEAAQAARQSAPVESETSATPPAAKVDGNTGKGKQGKKRIRRLFKNIAANFGGRAAALMAKNASEAESAAGKSNGNEKTATTSTAAVAVPTAIAQTAPRGSMDACEAAARKMDFAWPRDVGTKPGIEVWRVENYRTELDVPKFGVQPWPVSQYGQFHRGDSYVLLHTKPNPYGGEQFWWDIYFWIGSGSTQDEYGVAAYKTVELDDLLGGGPVQHRELEGYESKEFGALFPNGITYLEGGIDSGFRHVEAGEDDLAADIKRLYRVYKRARCKTTRMFEVPMHCSSLSDGDAFLLDAGSKIYTWFGRSVSSFEKSKSAQVAHNLWERRLGKCDLVLDVDDTEDGFWELLGGRGEIGPARDDDVDDGAESREKKMYVISDASGTTKVKEVPLATSSLVSDDVCLIDGGDSAYIWVGKGSTKGEKQQAMLISHRYLKAMGRGGIMGVTRVLEGQEVRCGSFLKVFE